MQTLVIEHPLVAHKLTVLRDERTDSPTFRLLVEELVTLLAYEATREVRTVPVRHHDAGRRDRRRHGWPHPSRSSCRSCGPGWACWPA